MAANTAARSTRRVYSAEELHRLRNTQSQPKLSEAIEEHDGEDADLVKVNMRFINHIVSSPQDYHVMELQHPDVFPTADEGYPEHVLRVSKSFTARSFRGRQSTASSLRVPSNISNNENLSITGNDAFLPPLPSGNHNINVLDEVITNGQALRTGFRPGRSPTPSLKKAAVEAIVKSHGSPSHVRVTAGGRIVPSEQSPLCQPRYGYSAIQTNGGLIKFAPNQRYSGRADDLVQATPQDGQIVQDMAGNFHQVVAGRLLPLPIDRDGATMLHCHAPNLNFVQRPSSQGANIPAAPPAGPAALLPQLTIEQQITTLEKEYVKLEEDLKVLNRNEAVHGRDMPRADKERLFARRKALVSQMNTVRVSLKELKNQPPANAPTSPRAMQNRQSISVHTQGPGFVPGQPMMNVRAPPQAHNSLFAVPQPGFGPRFGPTPSPDDGFNASQWFNSTAGMLGMPPPFDGAMSMPLSYPAAGMQVPTLTAQMPAPIPQGDGTHSLAASLADLRIPSPDRSRAVSIKAPDAKSANALKSALNPMSPVYRPGTAGSRDSAPAVNGQLGSSQSLMHKLCNPTQGASKSSNATEETVSPVKRKDLIHSSSISSLATADFFPGNPREHSSRQHTYAQPDYKTVESPAGEANLSTPVRDAHTSAAPDTGNGRGPVAPPGTPVYCSSTTTYAPQPAKAGDEFRQPTRPDIANRQAYNVSPKNKRDFHFVQEHPAQIAVYPSSSPADAQSPQSAAEFPDLTAKPRDWLEGYTNGLQRRHFQPTCSKDWLDGYCDGLRASASLTAARASSSSLANAPHTSSPMRVHSRRPSPVMPSRSSSKLQAAENTSAVARPPFENSTHSMDCLKQAVFAPHNETAILTPAANGPHVKDTTNNLGAWAKKAHNGPTVELPGLGYPFPQRNAADRQSITSESANDSKVKSAVQDRVSEHLAPARPGLPLTLSTASIISGSVGTGGGAPTPANRVSSLTSIDSSMSYQYPANRVMTPGEWRSAGASQSPGLVTGFFAQGQFDGTMHARLSSGGRFREGSIDRVTSPSTSPRPMSPSTPTGNTPGRRDSKRNSPRKGPSPTKVKFESLAEKVGIKVTSPTPSEAGDDSAEPVSPSGKRHWGVREWIKGNKTSNA